jgi:hypothetical protein
MGFPQALLLLALLIERTLSSGCSSSGEGPEALVLLLVSGAGSNSVQGEVMQHCSGPDSSARSAKAGGGTGLGIV